MTKFHKDLTTCPHCASEEEVVIWDLIDVAEDPDLKDRVLKKDIQLAECQNCGEMLTLAEPFLYVDDEHELLFYYCPQYKDILANPADREARRQADGSNLPPELATVLDEVFPPVLNSKKMRIIPFYNDLMEKIHAAEAGLDDRLMEVVKVALKTRYLDEEGISFEEMFFLSASDTILLFQVYGADTGWNSLEIFRDVYDNAASALADSLPKEGRWLQVDENYGLWLIKA